MRRILTVFALVAACVAAPAYAERTEQEEANIANAIAFYEAAINERDFEKARPYMGDGYIQHNPLAPTGMALSKQTG